MIKYLIVYIFLTGCAERIELRAESKRVDKLDAFEDCLCADGYCHRHVLKEKECQIIHETWKGGIFGPHTLYTISFDFCTQDYIMIGRCVLK